MHRPPGAIAEADFLQRCTGCADCVEACPHDALLSAPPRLRQAAGTPIIDAAAAPCRACADTPCITACETGALLPDGSTTMGTASIQEWNCLAHLGSFCSVCREQCPVPGAIEVSAGRPRIDAEQCTGCGVCLYVCPAPQNAILLMPRGLNP